MASGTARTPGTVSPSELRNALVRIASQERVLARPIELIAFAADASFYRLVPKAVVLTNGAKEIKVFDEGRELTG
jgi:D-lactate dehydrogenase